MIDLFNKIFGRWTVVKYTKTINRNAYWLCRCDCGNTKEVNGRILRRGQSKSCGCFYKETRVNNIKDLTGCRFGKLAVLERAKNKNNRRGSCWLCKCDCGNTKVIRGDGLKYTRSCGCISRTLNGLSANKNDYSKYRNSNPIIRLRGNISRIINHAMKGKKNGKSVFEFLPYTFEQLKEHMESQFEPWMSWENYGGKTKNPKKTWWIDHIIPQSSFIFESMTDKAFQECWALSNLRPLEKIENIKKGAR